jgi:hypothetical protein
MYEVQRLQVPHARSNLRRHVQETVKAARREAILVLRFHRLNSGLNFGFRE